MYAVRQELDPVNTFSVPSSTAEVASPSRKRSTSRVVARKKPTAYLEGPIAHDPNGHEWRERVIEALSDCYDFINPLTSVGDFRVPLNELRNRYATDESARTEFGTIMEKVIKGDLADLERADVEVAYLPAEPRSFGTICGVFYFKKILMKSPVVLIAKDRLWKDLNNWELALADAVFFNFEDAIAWLRNRTTETA